MGSRGGQRPGSEDQYPGEGVSSFGGMGGSTRPCQ
jgi:hypothetical protein